MIPIPSWPITSNASEPVALNIVEPETKISLKCEPIDMNAVPATDSLTFKPVLSSNCNFENCLLYVLPSTSEPVIWNGTFTNPEAFPVNEPVNEPVIESDCNEPEILTEPVNWCVSSLVLPNIVEPDSKRTDDVTIEVWISFAVIIPST